MIKLKSSSAQPIEISSKSTSDLRSPAPEAVNVRNSTPNISQVNNNQLTKNQIKEQKNLEKRRLAEQKELERKQLREQRNLEKKRLAEQKNLEKQQLAEQRKRDKLAAQQQRNEEKLRKQEGRHAQNVQQTSDKNRKVQKRTAPQPTTQSNVPTNRDQVSSEPSNHQSNATPQTQAYSTNTIESSISRSSGPPPYAPPETVPNSSDDTGNTRFTKSDDTGSWDLISQHRQQINRPKVTKSVPKQTHLDLNYNVGNTTNKEDNSEA